MRNSESARGRLQARRQRIADVVIGIVQRSYLGALIHGPGGNGKSYEIFNNLDGLEAPYALANSRLTALGLFQFLSSNSMRVCVIEDAESILEDRNALGVLRSATQGSQVGRDGRQIRRITFFSHGKQRELIFGGTVILAMNRNLSQISPEALALATRMQVVDYSLDDDEVKVLMYDIAAQTADSSGLSCEERSEVTEFVIERAKAAQVRLNLRMQRHAFETFRMYSLGLHGLDWRDTVDSQICGYDVITTPVVPASMRTSRIEAERELVRSILHLPPAERLAVWTEKSGGSRASFYRRLRDLGELDNQSMEPLPSPERMDSVCPSESITRDRN